MNPHPNQDGYLSDPNDVSCEVCGRLVEDRRRKVCSKWCADKRFSGGSNQPVDDTEGNDGSVTTRGIRRDSSGRECSMFDARSMAHALTRPPPAAPARVRFSSLPGHPRPSHGPAYGYGTQPPLQQRFFPPARHGTMGPPPVPSQGILSSTYGRGTPTYASQQYSSRASVPNQGQYGHRAYDTNPQTFGTSRPNYPGQAPADRSRYLPEPHAGTTREHSPSPQQFHAERERREENTEEETVRFFSTHRLRLQDRGGHGDDPAGKGKGKARE
ncbi:hypothetical protein F5X97DRAFT_322611 [Nemania serpens]|nr:hypothetical protein F5X97DRAFT_322611 [Nemania serpens]